MFKLSNCIQLVKKDLRLEWRQKSAISAIFVYVISTTFVLFFAFKGSIEPKTWISLFWIISLFSATSAAAQSFQKEGNSQFYYLRNICSPIELIVSKCITNTFLLLILSIVTFSVMTLFFGAQIENTKLYFVAIMGASIGLSILFTLLSAITARTQNLVLISILGFPLVIPMLQLVVKLSLLTGINEGFGKDKLIAIGSIFTLDLIIFILSLILEQSIRNLFFHVPMWFTMIALMLSSTIFGIYYLVKEDIVYDVKSYNIAVVGFVFGLMGLATGMVWAKVTWGAWWVFQEVKLNAAGAGVLIYAAYFILRGSLEEEEKRARFSAVYNVFAFVLFYVFIMVIPRLDVNSLHPGNGGNPGFNSYDLDNNLRKLFYPAVIGFILLGGWISQLFIRIELIKRKKIGLDD